MNTINKHVSCEVHAAVHFLLVENCTADNIHQKIIEVYYVGLGVMSDIKVWQWCRLSKERQINVHDEELSGHPTVMMDSLVKIVNAKICENQLCIINDLWCFNQETSLQ